MSAAREACEHCITCGDEGTAMFVCGTAHGGTATCVDATGALHAVAVELVEPVGKGDELLVHAGVALARLGAGHGARA